MSPQLLAEPVEYGDVRLAPTTELAGLAELAAAVDEGDRIATLTRVAAAIRAEDAARAHMARTRALAERADRPSLPKRR